ncbi:glycosyltransferase family 2 protein [Candidatus Uhrbacteria bacterium]|nr:glycosyltransferase family 2 protein [Candidatus Uhrbacteria bacterium]
MISTITVNYRTADYLERMLESLLVHHKNDDIEIIVVENNSGDDLTKLINKFPEVKFISSNKNLGFAGGCNLGIQSAHGDYLVLINPDIIFTGDALYQIRDAMDLQAEIGIGGVSLKNLDGTQQKCVWRFPTPIDQLFLLLKIHHLMPNIQPISNWRMDDFDYTKDCNVDQVMGAFFCIRRKLIEQIGLLDDGFFMWYEEVDYCKRAKNAGWRVRYFANIKAKHKKGSSFDRVGTLKKQNMFRRSVRRYIIKYFGVGIGLIFTLLEPIFWIFSVIASVLKPL